MNAGLSASRSACWSTCSASVTSGMSTSGSGLRWITGSSDVWVRESFAVTLNRDHSVATGLSAPDADAVRERELAVHDLGRLRVALGVECDAAHVAGAVAGADALGRRDDADVGEEDRTVGRDADPERGAGLERLRAQRVAGGRLQDVADVLARGRELG